MSEDNNIHNSAGKRGRFRGLFSFFGQGNSKSDPIHLEINEAPEQTAARPNERFTNLIEQSDLISRDLSWLKFNERVLDQARQSDRNLFDRLKFLAITSSNLDEFFTIRVGSLYNYLDFGKERIDYSGLREIPFKKVLFRTAKEFVDQQNQCFEKELMPLFPDYHFSIGRVGDLTSSEREEVKSYFERTVYPMLTPMLYDYTHSFPVLVAKVLILGVLTQAKDELQGEEPKLSFVQLPPNLPRFYVIEREEELIFVPLERIVREFIGLLYRNVDIISTNVFRIMRNEDFSLDESDDIETSLVDEIRQKIKNRRLGRLVKLEVESDVSSEFINLLKKRWEIDDYNIFYNDLFIDYTGLWQIIRHPEFKGVIPTATKAVPPIGLKTDIAGSDIFEAIRERDILLHHPYNNFEPVIRLLEQAAEDPKVLSIKLTIYRLAKNSRITDALLRAAENGKHVAALFEVKARFDEENNIKEAQRLQKAGCFVIYGIGLLKTHTKLLLIVRNEGEKVGRYAHLSSGNYNEDTSRLYTDIGLLTANDAYTDDISEFFNVITGHSLPGNYSNLITAPRHMRDSLIELIRSEAANAVAGKPAGICIKINSLEDKAIIEELYEASKAGVPVQLIVRGICCLRPGRAGLSENISVRSIVGNFLEHSRLFYFHNQGMPLVYGGSADVMVRSFDKRIESLFLLIDEKVRREAICILQFNLRDNVNSYELKEDGNYIKLVPQDGEVPFNIHERFFTMSESDVSKACLFKCEVDEATSVGFQSGVANPESIM